MNDLPARLAAALSDRRAAHRFRTRLTANRRADGRIEIDGTWLIDAGSNDYLGLSKHPAVIDAAVRETTASGVGSGASPLVSGYTPAHHRAEVALARWKSTESAVLLGSGYTANLSAVQALAAIARPGGVRFLIDKLVHASLVDAVRGVAAATPTAGFRVFPHNDLSKLRRLLADAPAGQMQVIVTESIFSMDGDAADLPGLVALREDYNAVLLLDEAHGSGVFGPGGAGYAASLNLAHCVDVTIVTLSKAMGVAGGAVCGSADLVNAVVNFARPYLYSTNLPPASAAAIEAAGAILQTDPTRQHRLAEMTTRVRNALAEAAVPLLPGVAPILPVVLGDETRCLQVAAALRERGIFTIAIRPPTVPAGFSRLRLTLSSAMSDTDVATLIDSVIATCGNG